MGCFVLLSPMGGLRVEHFEEIVFFEPRATRTAEIVVTAIVTNHSSDPARIGFLHRKRLAPVDRSQELAAPDSTTAALLFYGLFDGRARYDKETNRVSFRRLDPGGESFRGEPIEAELPLAGSEVHILPRMPDRIRHDFERLGPEDVPYTHFEVGPLQGRGATTLLHFSAALPEAVFRSLAPEIPGRGIRFCDIYGPEIVVNQIFALELPAFEARCPASGSAAREYLEALLQRRAAAGCYAVAAIDSPNCNPRSYKAMIMNLHARNLTEGIDKSVFKHTLAAGLAGRVHFFVNVEGSEEFAISLAGPITAMAPCKV